MRFTFAILPVAVLGSAVDPCARLCAVDGPLICTDGSYNKNGVCHRYLFRGDPSVNDYCYHSSLTASTCPGTGRAVTIADAQRLIALKGEMGHEAVPRLVDPSHERVIRFLDQAGDVTTVSPFVVEAEDISDLQPTQQPNYNADPKSLPERLSALRAKVLGRFTQSYRIPLRRVNIFINRDMALMESLPILNGPVHPLVQEHLYVLFTGEQANGQHSTKEWMTEITRQMFSEGSGFFVSSDAAHPAAHKVNQYGLTRPQARDVYRASGRFLALSLMRNHPLGIELPVTFYAKLLDMQLTLEDVQDEDRPLVRYLRDILNLPESELVNHPIKIDGEEVIPTMDNRAELVLKKVNNLVKPDVAEAIFFIRQGFNAMIPVEMAKGFLTANEMKLAILGNPDIDIEDFFANSVVEMGHDQRDMFHRILASYSEKQRREFLCFVTNQSQLPVGGFAQIKPPIFVSGNQNEIQDKIPRGNSNEHSLLLPDYPSESQMREKLRLAISPSRFAFL